MQKHFKLLISLILFCCKIFAQNTIAYPTGAQSITKNLDSTLLTVQLAFGASCNATTATIKLPTGVEYIPGSVNKTSGSAVGISIVESNITNKRKPIFALNGINAAGDITFTIKRKADCTSGNTGKDTVLVNGSCGTFDDDVANVNTYNIYAPVAILTAPPAINNAIIGNVYNRSGGISSTGNGCIDTLRFFIVYPNAGIELINNELILSGNSLFPYQINGDTLFFKIFGKTYFNGSDLLCNGSSVSSSVSFTENIRIKKCNYLTTNYGVGWGKSKNNLCQLKTTSSVVTLVNGSAKPVAVFNSIQSLSYCRNGIYDIVYTNNTTGGAEANMYNVSIHYGHSYGYSTALWPTKMKKVSLISTKINGNNIPIKSIKSLISPTDSTYELGFGTFLSDPDGAAVGFEDLDGDGQFDDLASGKSITIRYEEKWNCNASCPTPEYNFAPRTQLNYQNMCGDMVNVTNMFAINPYWHYLTERLNIVLPSQVVGGTPFNTQVCLSGQMQPPTYRPTDSLFFEITYPPGFSFVGNVVLGGVVLTASDYTFVNNKLTIFKKGYTAATCLTYDMIFNCGVSSNVVVNYKAKYIGDNSCSCEECLDAKDQSINIKCPSPCKNGIINYAPSVKRLSFGYTDRTLTNKVLPSAITGLALKTAFPKDTIMMTIGAKQQDKYDNLHYYYKMPRTLNNERAIEFIEGRLYHQSAANKITSKCVIDKPLIIVKSNFDTYDYDLSGCLQDGVIAPDDSVWLEITYRVTTAENGKLFGSTVVSIPNTDGYFYNLDENGNEIYCDKWATDFALCGLEITVEPYGSVDVNGCGIYYMTGEVRMFNREGGDIFPNEYRPTLQIDSITVIIPAGYQFYSGWATSMEMSYWYSSNINYAYSRVTVIPQVNGNKVTLINPKNGSWYHSDLLNSTNYNQNRFYIPVQPSCAAPTGATQGGVNFYAKNYFYADKVGESYVALRPTNFTTFLNLAAINKPTIALQNTTGSVDGVSEQHYWDVQITNPGNTTAPNLWMALDRGFSGITIDSVIYTPSNLPAVAIPYAPTKNWYKISSAGIAGTSVQKMRIYFKYSSCNTDSIKMIAGWNCSEFPTDPTNYPCQLVSQWLKVVPQKSQLQLSILKQPNFPSVDMCVTDVISVNVNSAEAGDVNNPILKIIPPAGVSIKTPIAVEYPLGNGNWQSLNPTLVNGEYILNLEDHTLVGVGGLRGKVKKPDAIDRQIRVNVVYETVCGFTNGTKLNFVVQGQSNCGAPSIGNNDEIKTNPINITGSTTVGSAATNITVSNNDIKCGETNLINVSITPLIAATTNSDTVTIILPPGINFTSNSLIGCATCNESNEITANGYTMVKVKLPNNAPSNTAINFSIGVTANSNADCRDYPLEVQTIRTGVLLNCNTTNCSKPTPVVMSTATGKLTVKKAELQVLEFKLLGTGPFNPGGTYTAYLRVQNFGTYPSAAGYVAEAFCFNDVNPFASFTIAALGVNQIDTITKTITLPATCPGGSSIIAKVRKNATLPIAAKQCLCSESAAINAVVLPIKIISFSAILSNNNTVVDFKCANEIVNTQYQLLRSKDGITFDVVKEIKIAQFNNGEYTFTDNLSNVNFNKLYYRLKVIEVGGRVQYSEIGTINKNDKNIKITVTPNPAKSFIELKFNSTANETVQITLIDAKGNKVKQCSKQITKGINTILLNQLNTLASGTYVLKVNSKLINNQTKIQIIK
jgi:Secretion system C-terminal sorting domain